MHARVHELLQHHEVRLAATREAVAGGAGTAFETAQRLGWTRRAKHFDTLDVFNQLLATGETAAHLEVLVARGVLRADRVRRGDRLCRLAARAGRRVGSPDGL